jgi:hypothetical protein
MQSLHEAVWRLGDPAAAARWGVSALAAISSAELLHLDARGALERRERGEEHLLGAALVDGAAVGRAAASASGSGAASSRALSSASATSFSAMPSLKSVISKLRAKNSGAMPE